MNSTSPNFIYQRLDSNLTTGNLHCDFIASCTIASLTIIIGKPSLIFAGHELTTMKFFYILHFARAYKGFLASEQKPLQELKIPPVIRDEKLFVEEKISSLITNVS